MIKFIKENKKAIIISLSVGILLIYSRPLLDFVGKSLVEFLISISVKFSNSYYQLVARNNQSLSTDLMFVLVFLLVVFFVTEIFSNQFIELKEQEDKILKMEKSLLIENGEKKEEKIDIESMISKSKTRITILKNFLKILLSTLMVVILIIWINAMICSQANLMNISFRNKLTILSIHLTDSEIKELKAKWVQMKSRDDYDKIKNMLDDNYKKYNIKE